MTWYAVGYLVALGYQLADEDFRLYDTIVCPLLWPMVLVLHIALAIQRRDQASRQDPLSKHNKPGVTVAV